MEQHIILQNGSTVDYETCITLFARLGQMQQDMENLTEELSCRKPTPEELHRLKSLLDTLPPLREQLLPEDLHEDSAVRTVCSMITDGRASTPDEAFNAYRDLCRRERLLAEEVKAAFSRHKEQAAHEARMAEMARETEKALAMQRRYTAAAEASEREARSRIGSILSLIHHRK